MPKWIPCGAGFIEADVARYFASCRSSCSPWLCLTTRSYSGIILRLTANNTLPNMVKS